jgi:hypothetical protein
LDDWTDRTAALHVRRAAKGLAAASPILWAKERNWPWEAACEVAGISGVSLYPGTKHTTATELIRRGVDPKIVQRALGHAAPRSTDHCVVLADRDTIDVFPEAVSPPIQGTVKALVSKRAQPATRSPETTRRCKGDWRPQRESNPCYRLERPES